MKSKFIQSSLTLIKKNKEITELDEKKLKYGLEGFYNLATKTIVMLGLSILFDTVLEYFLLIIVYSTLRLYGFGIHMKTSLQCWCTSVPIYMGGCLLIKYVVFSKITSIAILIFGVFSFLLFAPADTPARPLIHKEKRIRAKILSLLILVCYILLFFNFSNKVFQNLIVYAVLVESISINPIIYMLFHTPFNNYKKYKQRMV